MRTETLNMEGCIRTFTGIYMDVFNPQPEMICLEDIAHGLSHQCRFGGHLPKFYSVAQHSVMCANLVSREYAMAALLHDASEAYLLDIPKPIKNLIPQYSAAEDKLMQIIADMFEFQFPLHKAVKSIDRWMLECEWESLMLGRESKEKLECWSPELAKANFLSYFNSIA
ncbi:hypothetical protein LZD49_07215 [Dyadobacter sp. CY261]|uniref:hypothetical protein n=1 Tax=Dyadobacter sp. CY261 TaxID=2907203 RepID=UPI001F38ECF0|nr:hypothetical protein [Dyadobacter sp. CY261]MCF0070255.1 hypothetical protein [Dyadobacter sp. CY261]